MDFQTPQNICELMVSMIPSGSITVLEPTPGIGNLVNALKIEKYEVIAPSDFWETSGFFDAIVMNPPFTPMLKGYEILDKCLSLSNNIIALMPWLTVINSEKRTKKIVEFGLKTITHLPRSTFKGSRVQTCILQIINGWNEPCRFIFEGLNT